MRVFINFHWCLTISIAPGAVYMATNVSNFRNCRTDKAFKISIFCLGNDSKYRYIYL